MQRLWQLMAICVSLFPPSGTLQNWLTASLHHWRPAVGAVEQRSVARLYRQWCIDQLKQISETRSVSARVPPIDELLYYVRAPRGPPSLFGCTLERAMAIQAKQYPQFGSKLPVILTVCIRLIRELDGFKTQGIFRLPGNSDNIKALQLLVNRGDFALCTRADITVHDVASLLKLWLRGLAEPLVPDSMYNGAIAAPDSIKNALDTFKALPDINRDVVAHLVNFLQSIAYPENQAVNKMSLSNLAVVFAPCECRSHGFVLALSRCDRSVALSARH